MSNENQGNANNQSAPSSDQIEAALQHMGEAKLTRDDVQKILNQFAKHIGLEALPLDKDGSVQITIDDSIELSLVHLPHFPGVVAASPLPQKAAKNSDILRRLLQANMSWSNTHGGCFAILPPQNELMLCRLTSLVTGNIEVLDQELAAFVDLVKHWTKEIEKDLAATVEPTAVPQARFTGTQQPFQVSHKDKDKQQASDSGDKPKQPKSEMTEREFLEMQRRQSAHLSEHKIKKS
jgi:hypothetical protein